MRLFQIFSYTMSKRWRVVFPCFIYLETPRGGWDSQWFVVHWRANPWWWWSAHWWASWDFKVGSVSCKALQYVSKGKKHIIQFYPLKIDFVKVYSGNCRAQKSQVLFKVSHQTDFLIFQVTLSRVWKGYQSGFREKDQGQKLCFLQEVFQQVCPSTSSFKFFNIEFYVLF